MERIKTSNHVKTDRMDRVLFIAEHIGWGEIVLEWYDPERTTWECLTSTGIILIKSKNKKTLITAYPADVGLTIRLYRVCGYDHCNDSVLNRVKKNRQLMNRMGYSY